MATTGMLRFTHFWVLRGRRKAAIFAPENLKKTVIMSKWMVVLLAITMALTGIGQSCAQNQRTLDSLQARIAALEMRTERVENFHRRFIVGGYGEAVMSRMFYSDNYKRYTNADLYKDDDGFGQFDLPHVVIYMGYDFGHGWTMGTEIEFEHGGAETAVEIKKKRPASMKPRPSAEAR